MKQSADTRKPYSGPVRSLVIALDVGTTFSGVSYAILEPGEIPKIHGVTRLPGQEHVVGTSKIPSVMYYDKAGRMMAAGADVDDIPLRPCRPAHIRVPSRRRPPLPHKTPPSHGCLLNLHRRRIPQDVSPSRPLSPPPPTLFAATSTPRPRLPFRRRQPVRTSTKTPAISISTNILVFIYQSNPLLCLTMFESAHLDPVSTRVPHVYFSAN